MVASLLRERWLLALWVAVGLALALAYQRPLAVPLNIGREEGVDNDLPFLNRFNAPEQRGDGLGKYRWTTLDSWIEARDIPGGAYLLSLRQINGGTGEIEMRGRQFPATASGRVLHLLAPAEGHVLSVPIRTAASFSASDPRELGVALQGGALQRLAGPAVPPWRPIAAWLGAITALWAVVRLLGGAPGEALLLSGGLAAGAVAATVAAPLRVGLATGAISQITLYGLLAALAGWRLIPALLGWFEVRADQRWLRWLLLAALAVFALKLGGRLVPQSMPGDIGFHRNRLWEIMRGNPYQVAVHRGVPFPYPSALYALLAPLTLLGLSEAALLELAAALCEALALPLIFGLVLRATGRPRAALLAALGYGLFPAGFMTVAWSFDAHIFAQFAALGWCALLVRWWPRIAERRVWLGLTGGLVLVGLSHFGFYINISLLTGLLAVWSWLRWPAFRRQSQALALSLIAMQVIVWAIYYTAFASQLQCVINFRALYQSQRDACPAQSYSPETRQLISRAALLWDIVETGFWRHYGLVPVLLAPLGLWLLRRPGAAGEVPVGDAASPRLLPLVLGATFLVSLGLGAVPLISAAPITTRWLMFSAWAIAVCLGVVLDRLWERGAAGRAAAAACSLAIAAMGLFLWLQTVVYRIRPPEPF